MKNRSMTRNLAVAGLLCCLTPLVGAGEQRTVRDVPELVRALEDLCGDTTNEIVLKPGKYDLKDVPEASHGSFNSRLYIYGCTLRGESSDPRQSVIYDSTASGRILLVGENALVRDLAVSNGYASTHAAGIQSQGGYTVASGSLCSNVVVTCCRSGGNGGGITAVNCRDCESCFNTGNHGAGASYTSCVGGSLHDNVAQKSGGGGMNVRADGVKVYFNRASYSAGLSANSAISIENCMIVSNISQNTANNANQGGGGIGSIASELYLKVSKSMIAYNIASNFGGGTAYCDLDKCQVFGNWAPNGGGIYKSRAVGCVISNNVARNGGGAYEGMVTDSDLMMNFVDTDATKGTAYGGGAYLTFVTNCQVRGNATAATTTGGGTGSQGGAGYNATFVRCDIVDNFARVGAALQGGGAENCVISNNATMSCRYNLRAINFLRDCKVYGRHFDSIGAVCNSEFVSTGDSVTLEPGHNVHQSGTFTLDQSVPLIANTQSTTLAATNCLFRGCRNIPFLLQGQYNFADRVVRLVNCTIADNHLGATISSFPGASGFNGSLLVENCIFSGNKNKDGSVDCDFSLTSGEKSTSTQVSFDHCIISTGLPEDWAPAKIDTLISKPARFDSTNAEYPYSLKWSSPARWAGVVRSWMADATDIRGQARLREDKQGINRVDIGCYQCWLDPNGFMMLFR